jgi:hypothetical protein
MNTYWVQVSIPNEPIARTLVIDAPNQMQAALEIAECLHTQLGHGAFPCTVLEIDPAKLKPGEPLNDYNWALLAKVPRKMLITRDDIINVYGLSVSTQPPRPNFAQTMIPPRSKH